MAEQGSDLDRTEDATPRRLEKAREEGNIPRSIELNTLAVLVAGGAAMSFLAHSLMLQFESLMRFGLRLESQDLAPAQMLERFAQTLWYGVEATAPVLALLMVFALLAPMAISGWLFSTQLLSMRFSRISPLAGIKRVFSSQGLMELVKAIVKVVLLGALVFWVLSSRFEKLMYLSSSSSFTASLALLWDTLYLSFWALVGGLVLIVAADVPFVLWNYQKSLRMTKQEVIDEQRETNLSPEVRQRIRAAQRALTERRMLEAVQTAQVVVVNPSEYAVALMFKVGEQIAPVVVARGRDELAARIRQVAQEHDVPIVRAPPLARALYHHASLDRPIPQQLFQATALVFGYLMDLDTALQQRRPQPNPPLVWPVPPAMDYDPELEPSRDLF